MRTQLDLLTDRVMFAEACSEEFREQVLALSPTTSVASDNKIVTNTDADFEDKQLEALGEQDVSLHRCSSRSVPSGRGFVVPEVPTPPEPGASPALLLRLRVQAPSLSAQQLSTLSLNLSVLELGVPNYFDTALKGNRLRHPIELLGRLSNTALESLTLELRTLNMDYLGAQYSQNRMMRVRDTDIAAFVRQGRSIVSQEVNRTIGYYHEVNRIAHVLCYYYSDANVPLDNDSKTRPLLRSLCRSLSMAINNLKVGTDTFERRLRELAPCNAALQMGVNEARSTSVPSGATPTSTARNQTLPFTLSNVMRPSQTLKVSTPRHVCTLAQFFTEYAQIMANSFGKWSMLHSNLERLVTVIRDSTKRESEWIAEDASLSSCAKPCSSVENIDPCDDEQELAILRSLQCELVADDDDAADVSGAEKI